MLDTLAPMLLIETYLYHIYYVTSRYVIFPTKPYHAAMKPHLTLTYVGYYRLIEVLCWEENYSWVKEVNFCSLGLGNRKINGIPIPSSSNHCIVSKSKGDTCSTHATNPVTSDEHVPCADEPLELNKRDNGTTVRPQSAT